MSLRILFLDELNGFYRSRVMIALWIGLPAMALLLYFLVPDLEGLPITQFTALLVSSIGGLLTSVLIVVNILNEKERKVYDLFLIRPIKRRDLILAKFGAVYICVAVAGLLAIFVSASLDAVLNGYDLIATLTALNDPSIIALSMMAISCSAGVLIGVFANSVLVGVLLVLYGGNQLSSLVILPVLLETGDIWMSGLYAVVITLVLMLSSILVFQRKEL